MPFEAAVRQGAVQKTIVVALSRWESGAQEVFAVTVRPGHRQPELIDDDKSSLKK